MLSQSDPEKKKISLGMKDRSRISLGKLHRTVFRWATLPTCKIVKLMSFGAFAEVVPGVDGLIHISQIADHRVEKPEDELAEGQIVDVKITDINHGEPRRSPCPVVLLCAKQLLTMRKITTKNNLSSLSQTVT